MGFLTNSVVNANNSSSPYQSTLENAMLNGQQYLPSSGTSGSSMVSGLQSPSQFNTSVFSSLGAQGSKAVNKNDVFGKLQSGINSTFSSLNKSIAKGFQNINSEIQSIFGQNQGNNGKSSVQRVLGSSTNQKGFMGNITQGYQDGWSNIKNATAIKTETPSSIASSYGATQKPPVSSLLKLSNGTNGMAPAKLGSSQNQSSTYITGSQSTLAQRYGADITGGSDFDFKSAGDSFLKSSTVSGMFGGIGHVVGGVMGVGKGLLGGVSETVGGIAGGVGSLLGGVSNTFRGYVGDVSQEIFGSVNGMDGYYNSNLPSMADYEGNPVPGYGYGGELGYEGCMGLSGALGGMGCNTNLNDLTSIPYSALGSAMNALQELAAESGLTGLLGDIIECKNMTKYNFENLHNLFYQFSGQDIDVSQLCMGDLGLYNIGQLTPGGGGSGVSGLGLVEETPLTPEQALDKSCLTSNLSLLKNIVNNQNLDSTKLTAVKNVVSNLGWELYQPYTTGEMLEEDNIWDSSTLTTSKSVVTQSLLGTTYSDVAYLAGGVEIN